MAQKKCNHCGVWKDEEEFNWRYKAIGVRNRTCRECMVEFNKRYYQGENGERHLRQVKERTEKARATAKEYVYQYLLTHPCVGPDRTGCPYNETDPVVLEFHHREPGGKDMDITQMLSGGYSLKRIQAELEKCDVLCASCHRRVTAKERGWFRGLK